MQLLSGRDFFGDEIHGFYTHLLPKLRPGLMLDIGATIGGYSQLMRRHSPMSRVVAYEPFPGNLPHFRTRIGADPMVTLRDVAVSDAAGVGYLYVSSTVKEGPGFWGKYAGSSAMGTLVAGPGNKTHKVRTVKLDDEFSENVRFMKMDARGGEQAVLRGARRLWHSSGIDAMSIPFKSTDGDFALLEAVSEQAYAMIDAPYYIGPKADADLSDWNVRATSNLSTGGKAVLASPKIQPQSDTELVSFFKEQREKAGLCWTHLMCLSPAAEYVLK